MELIITERSFEQPVEFDTLQAVEDQFRWCLEQHRVRFIRSYISQDSRRMICIYEAPDAEAVRDVNRTMGIPFDSVYKARLFEPGHDSAPVQLERVNE